MCFHEEIQNKGNGFKQTSLGILKFNSSNLKILLNTIEKHKTSDGHKTPIRDLT